MLECKKYDIYTGYYAMAKYYPFWFRQVAISRIIPKFWGTGNYDFLNDKRLAPTLDILKCKSTEEFEERFNREILSKLDPFLFGKLYHHHILMCYEAAGKFCHRHLVAKWLQKAGYSVTEFPAFRKQRGKIVIPGQLELFQEV